MRRLPLRHTLLAASLFALAACGMNGTDRYNEDDAAADTSVNSTTENLADTMASNDDGLERDSALDIPDSEERPTMQAQVVLDRQGFGPGVIDGKMGMSTENALEGFQEANDLEVTGKLDEATKTALGQWSNIPATRVVRIPGDWGELEYARTPEGAEAQSKMERLGYQSLDEKLAERFHTTAAVLEMLNPGGKPAGMDKASSTASGAPGTASPLPSPSKSAKASPTPTPSASKSGTQTTDAGPNPQPLPSKFAAGQLIRVPNIGADRIAPGAVDDPDWQQTLKMLGVGSEQPELAKVVVSKSGDTLKGYDKAGKLLVMFTVSSGSSEFPLPIGNWKILGIGQNPPFGYDPKVLSGGKEDGKSYTLPPGPNGPVGVVWIDLSKEHYGIHGTPDPETIGRAQSHGCVRLTNWDAARLAQMVDTKTKVEFVA